MKSIFVDTAYWIAVIRPDDPWAEDAARARERAGRARLVTTDEVLIELLNFFSSSGETLRRQAAKMARTVLTDSDTRVLRQSRRSLVRGIELYGARADKGYSLTNCISMNAMREEGIAEALTNDRHFMQEGFTVLMRRG